MRTEIAPLLVLGVGNSLLTDDGVGPELLDALRRSHTGDARIEFVDGGTQGLALLGYLEQRAALLVLDAVALGAEPGHVHVLERPQERTIARGIGAHGGNASELFAVARLLGTLPREVALVGVEPASIATGVGVSRVVEHALTPALAAAEECLNDLLERVEQEQPTCTS